MIGFPSSAATSFVSCAPPAARNRDDWPAARTTAATSLMRVARLRPRGDLHEKAADAHRAYVGVGYRDSGDDALQNPIETVLLRRPGAPRGADDRRLAAAREQQQVSGVDRHA